MRITIKKEVVKVEEKEVNVELRKAGSTVVLTVDGWNVFELKSNGKGALPSCISNWSGLQIDNNGRIMLEN